MFEFPSPDSASLNAAMSAGRLVTDYRVPLEFNYIDGDRPHRKIVEAGGDSPCAPGRHNRCEFTRRLDRRSIDLCGLQVVSDRQPGRLCARFGVLVGSTVKTFPLTKR